MIIYSIATGCPRSRFHDVQIMNKLCVSITSRTYPGYREIKVLANRELRLWKEPAIGNYSSFTDLILQI
ncbi:MAG: hypothetical protein F6K50_35965 [Moorea sp. SIO3I7]|nr:hypothetical protein [Moorena sp. SIO3I7]